MKYFLSLLVVVFLISSCTPKLAQEGSAVEKKEKTKKNPVPPKPDVKDNSGDDSDSNQPKKVDRTLPPDILGGDDNANNENVAKLKIYEEERDLGTIEYGDSIMHTFRYKNIGKVDFVIEQYTVGCGCTQMSEPKKRIVPGETGELTLQFNSKAKDGPGDYTSDALLVGNVAEGFLEFKMKIKVIAKKSK